jgi:hypothetical protein
MPSYTAEVVASARHDYENTDKTLARIALDHEVSERTINRWRDRDGWMRRSDRVHELPVAMRALQEVTTLLTVRDPPSREQPEQAEAPSAVSAIERVERLVAQELAAEEAARSRLGSLARTPADAERCARTLSTLTQTLHALARLRGGLAPDPETKHDAMPHDIDDFRNELARRIHAFVQSRTGGGLHGGTSGSDGPTGV